MCGVAAMRQQTSIEEEDIYYISMDNKVCRTCGKASKWLDLYLHEHMALCTISKGFQTTVMQCIILSANSKLWSAFLV